MVNLNNTTAEYRKNLVEHIVNGYAANSPFDTFAMWCFIVVAVVVIGWGIYVGVKKLMF